MSQAPPPTADSEPDRDAQMLARVAELEFALIEQLHADAMAAEDAKARAEASRACQRLARSLRQTLLLKSRLRGERARHDREFAPRVQSSVGASALGASPFRAPASGVVRPPAADIDFAAIRRRHDALRGAVRRVIWAEREAGEIEAEEACELALALDDTLAFDMGSPGFLEETLDAHVAQVCAGFDIPPLRAVGWRDLPDPDPAWPQAASSPPPDG